MYKEPADRTEILTTTLWNYFTPLYFSEKSCDITYHCTTTSTDSHGAGWPALWCAKSLECWAVSASRCNLAACTSRVPSKKHTSIPHTEHGANKHTGKQLRDLTEHISLVQEKLLISFYKHTVSSNMPNRKLCSCSMKAMWEKALFELLHISDVLQDSRGEPV